MDPEAPMNICRNVEKRRISDRTELQTAVCRALSGAVEKLVLKREFASL